MAPPNIFDPRSASDWGLAVVHREQVLEALPPGGKLLEYGSGVSTGWFRERLQPGQQLFSIEHDPEIARQSGARLVPYAPAGLLGTTAAEETLRPGWQNYVEIERLFPGCERTFSVILVDGVVRLQCLRHAGVLAAPGCTVFLHDGERKAYAPSTAHVRWRPEDSKWDERGRLLLVGQLLPKHA